MRKGISPLVATVLLVSITIVVAAVVASWANFFVKGKTDDIQKASDEAKLCEFANLRAIDDLKAYNAVDGKISIGVDNNGRVPLSNFTFIVKTKSGAILDPVSVSTDVLNPTDFRVLTSISTAAPSEVVVRSSCSDATVTVSFA